MHGGSGNGGRGGKEQSPRAPSWMIPHGERASPRGLAPEGDTCRVSRAKGVSRELGESDVMAGWGFVSILGALVARPGDDVMV